MKLYLAYGANTNFAAMKQRCPAAKYICNITINHHQLVFRGVADVIPARGRRVECAVWMITPECEAALDRFEGFPNFYVKKYVKVWVESRWHRMMLYVMRGQGARGQSIPYSSYEQCLREGYADCGMSTKQMDAAIKRAQEYTVRPNEVARVKSSKWAALDALALQAAAVAADCDEEEA